MRFAGGWGAVVICNGNAVVVVRIRWIFPSVALFTIAFAEVGIIDAVGGCHTRVFFNGGFVEAPHAAK